MSRLVLVLLLLATAACWECDEVQRARQAREAWDEPCHDESTLLATTSGSPSHASCPNKAHRMHVQISTTPSNEEIGALVFCECVRPGIPDAGGDAP